MTDEIRYDCEHEFLVDGTCADCGETEDGDAVQGDHRFTPLDANPYQPGTDRHRAWVSGRGAARSARDLEGEDARAWRRGFAAGGGGPNAPDEDHEHAFIDGRHCWKCNKTRAVVQAERDAYHRGWLARDDASNDDYLEGHRDGEGSDLDGDLADRVYRELHPGRLLDWDPDAARWREAIERALSRP